MEPKTLILSAKQMEQKIIRIAHEINEFNYDEPEIILIGLDDRGYEIAGRIVGHLKGIYLSKITLAQLKMNKQAPTSGDYQLTIDAQTMAGKSVVIVDDVLESGRTLIYACSYLLREPLKKLTTVVLVDRMHPKFPITADFVGLTLSTTLQEHIEVKLSSSEEGVYLV